MTLLKYALKNIRKEFTVHLLTAFQLAAAVIITLIMVSSLLIRFQYYTPFCDVFEGNGLCCIFDLPSSTDGSGAPEKQIYDEEMLNFLDGAEKVISCNSTHSWAVDENDEYISSIKFFDIHYDDDIIERFTPELSEGRWLRTSDKADCFEVVISENNYGWEVGDKIRICLQSVLAKDDVQEFLVVGKLRENAKIPGFLNGMPMEEDFRCFYGTSSFAAEGEPTIIMSSDYINKTTIYQGIFGSALIVYPSDYTEEMLAKEQQKLSRFSCVKSIQLRKMDAESKAYLYEQVYNLLPIIIVLLVLVIVSSISSSALSTRREMKSYTYFYITGLQWKQCAIISFLQSLIISAASLIISAGVVLFLCYSQLGEQFRLIFEWQTILPVFAIIVFFWLVSMLMPIIMLSRTSPKQILTK